MTPGLGSLQIFTFVGMGLNKKAAFRYRVIDQLFQNGHTRTIEEIQERVGEALRNEFGDENGISKRTLYYDFDMMRQPSPRGFNAPIECKHGLYQYAQKDFSIFAPQIEDADKKLIPKAISVLEQMQYIPLVRELLAFLKDLAGTVPNQTSGNKNILFDQERLAAGLEKMDAVQNAIDRRKPLSVVYLPFYEDLPLNMELHPYLIKEYRNRWYVIGWEKTAGQIYNLAFDRIVNTETENIPFIPPPANFDPATWFSNVVGVTIPENTDLQTIVFRVSADSAPYIRTKPLHHSQRMVDKLDDNSMVFSLEVVPNFELETLLLGYAEKLEVMEPEWFREKIKNRLNGALKNHHS